ncbi:guanine nucleotide binding protein, alpha subunit [Mycena galericulata]|nr:guanine nucleotide binding protein, alpha subunit [Mycena galericulata]
MKDSVGPEQAQSLKIDEILEANAEIAKATRKILVLGARGSGKATLMRHIKTLYGGLTDEERQKFTSSIHSTVLDVSRELFASLPDTIFSTPDLIACRQTILDHTLQGRHTLSQELARAVHKVWTNDDVRAAGAPLLDRSAIESLDRILHISSPDYIPTDSDILRCKIHAPPPIEEITVKLDERWTYTFVFPRQSFASKHKWLPSFEGIAGLLFVLNSDNYDRLEHMREAVALFDYVCTSPLFKRTYIHLVMNQSGSFIQKLAMSPLSAAFPDYSGGSDRRHALRYIVWRFLNLKQDNRNVHPTLVDVMDAQMVRAMMNRIIRFW